jgi:putative pyruvate formate lyase activating enzyme
MNKNTKVKIAWYGKHFGEEPPLVGGKNQGAGGIFFSGCNLRCVFCQNWQISQAGLGKNYSVGELAEIMLKLENDGAVNIDLVTPTIWWKQIVKALKIAKSQGLKIPIVWNSNAYEKVGVIKELDGLVDIYLPDFKYGDDVVGKKYSGIDNYSGVAGLSIKEMHRQLGNMKISEDGLARRGVLVRHLVLPNNLENSFKALMTISEIDKNLSVSLMRQYYPIHKAKQYPEINRPVKDKEFDKVFEYMIKLGLENGWVQEKNCEKVLIPNFTKIKPF